MQYARMSWGLGAAVALLCTLAAEIGFAGSNRQPESARLEELGLRLAPYGYVDNAKKWPHATILVCWERTAQSYLDEKQLVRQSIQDEFRKDSALVFWGWESCKPDDREIRIRILDVRPDSDVGFKRPLALGGALATVVTLNFDLNNWPCHATRDHCIIATSRHEFMHAVGVLHEQMRDDAPAECKAAHDDHANYDAVDPQKVGKYDAKSIMNYCSNIYDDKVPPQLSDIDHQTLHYLYPPG